MSARNERLLSSTCNATTLVSADAGVTFTDGTLEGEIMGTNLDCTWFIETEELRVKQVSLEFERFDLGEKDVLEVYGSNDTAQPPLVVYTGTEPPPRFRSLVGTAAIRLVTDNETAGTGFEIATSSSSSECGDSYIVQAGDSFTDGSAPEQTYSRQSTACMWRITADAGQRIHLDFERFSLASCCNNNVRIYDPFGGNHDPVIVLSPDSDAKIGSTLYDSAGPDVVVEFAKATVDGALGTGFAIATKSVDASTHRSVTLDAGVTFTDGSADGSKYADNVDTTWVIHATGPQQPRRVQLTFERFDLGSDGDYLEIFDGEDSELPVARYDGDLVPTVFQSIRSSVKLHFVAINSNGYAGFQVASASRGGLSEQCGETHHVRAGESFSDGSKQHENFGNALSCEWLITAHEAGAARVLLQFLRFALTLELDGTSDIMLEIYDGASASGIPAVRFNGNRLPPDFESSSNVALVRFTSGWYGDKGFEISTSVQSASEQRSVPLPVAVGENVTESTLLAASGSDTENRAMFRAFPGEHIELQFHAFALKEGEILELFEGDAYDVSFVLRRSFRWFESLPPQYRSDRESIVLRLITSSEDNTGSFALSSTASERLCGIGQVVHAGETFTDGSTESGNYQYNSDCLWRIYGSDGKMLRLHFHRLVIYHANPDVIRIYDGPSTDVAPARNITSTATPDDFVANGNVVVFTFQSGDSLRLSGFSVSVTEVAPSNDDDDDDGSGSGGGGGTTQDDDDDSGSGGSAGGSSGDGSGEFGLGPGPIVGMVLPIPLVFVACYLVIHCRKKKEQREWDAARQRGIGVVVTASHGRIGGRDRAPAPKNHAKDEEAALAKANPAWGAQPSMAGASVNQPFGADMTEGNLELQPMAPPSATGPPPPPMYSRSNTDHDGVSL